jgi:hypothetical protein
MSASWGATLADVAGRLNGIGVEWMLLGSAATALRGVAIVPGDIDIAIRAAEDVKRAATVLPTPENHEPEIDGTVDWISTVAQPALRFGDGGEQWTFGRWIVDGVKVELAHIDSPAEAALMLETRAPLVWDERETLSCDGQPVPTVPIEVQLATMVARQQDARIAATIAAVDVDRLNLPLLRRAISDRQLDVPEPVQCLLDQQTDG